MRKVLFIFCSILLTLISLLSVIFLPIKSEAKENKKDVIEIWHIDGMEGGIGSRINVIQKCASAYMKSTKCVIRVLSHTVYSAENSFQKGVYPDLISYTNGINLPYEKLLSFNYLGEKVYCASWCAGGYLLIQRKGETSKSLIVSQQEYTVPMLAIALSGVKLPIKEVVSSDKAIYSFYADKSCALLGTQRDLFRLENKGIEIDAEPLNGFNDLYQKISILCEEKKYSAVKNFLNYFLTYVKSEGALKNIGMLTSTGYNGKLCNEKLAVYARFSPEYTTQALINREQLQKIQNLAINFDKEQESIKNALKRLK
ncbi:MAG: hypothetical protein IJA15_04310 [Clostridia bacterium]|nr:hypothetical protein [Clostridia bacterium]